MNYIFDTNLSQERALEYFSTKEGISKDAIFQRLVAGIFRSYEKQSLEVEIKNSTDEQKAVIYDYLVDSKPIPIKPDEEIIQ